MAKAAAFDTSYIPALPATSTPGMVSADEQQLYFFLAKDSYASERIYVEIGTWLGLSTLRICQGLSEAGGDWKLVCYDRFTWMKSHDRKTGGLYKHELTVGASFEPKFRDLLGQYSERVTTCSGDLLEVDTHMSDVLEPEMKIGAMFIDASKGWGANVKLLKFFSDRFVSSPSSHTRLLFQDCLYFPAYKLLFLLGALESLRPAFYVEKGTSVAFDVIGDVGMEEIIREDRKPRRFTEADIYRVWERILGYIPLTKLQQSATDLALPLMLWGCGYQQSAVRECGRISIADGAERLVRRVLAESSDRAIRKLPIAEILGNKQSSS